MEEQLGQLQQSVENSKTAIMGSLGDVDSDVTKARNNLDHSITDVEEKVGKNTADDG